jgi:hypothetical protein
VTTPAAAAVKPTPTQPPLTFAGSNAYANNGARSMKTR